MELFLYVEADEYIETDHSEDLGVKFLAHSPIEPPFLKELGYGLAPGYHYLIALQQREVRAESITHIYTLHVQLYTYHPITGNCTAQSVRRL